MKLILDASMALSWLFERSKAEEKHCSELALSTLGDVEAFVPSLWHTEIANALLLGERRKVVSEAQVINYLGRLDELPIMTDSALVASHRDIVMALAREYSLTAYDATYLDLALRENAVLATFDAKLAAAMQKAGGTVFSTN